MTEQFRSQNWTAIWLELFVVIVGIFLGLQVSQWYERQQELELGESIVQRLDGEFAAIAEYANSSFTNHQETIIALEVVRQVLIDGDLQPDQEAQFLEGLHFAMNYDTGPNRSGTYVEILSSGQLRLLRNPELRLALSNYDHMLEKSGPLFSNLHMELRKHDAVFYRHSVRQPSQSNEAESSPTGILMTRGAIIGYDLGAMANDEEYVEAIDRLIEIHTYFQYWHGGIQRSASRVVTLIAPGNNYETGS